jgi:hypothetical protein
MLAELQRGIPGKQPDRGANSRRQGLCPGSALLCTCKAGGMLEWGAICDHKATTYYGRSSRKAEGPWVLESVLDPPHHGSTWCHLDPSPSLSTAEDLVVTPSWTPFLAGKERGQVWSSSPCVQHSSRTAACPEMGAYPGLGLGLFNQSSLSLLPAPTPASAWSISCSLSLGPGEETPYSSFRFCIPSMYPGQGHLSRSSA